MRSVAQIKDFATLQQAALLIEAESDRLFKLVEKKTRELADLKGDAAQEDLALELAKVERRRDELLKQLYGKTTERRPKPPRIDPWRPPARKKKDHPGRTPQLELPVEIVLHSLPDGEDLCPCCGERLAEWAGQYEESEEITVIERSFKIVKHRRQKYVCKCYGAVVTAPAPPKLQPKSRYSLDLAIYVAIAKYLMHLPLERQRIAMARDGLIVTRAMLWGMLLALSRQLKPTYDALREHIVAQPLVHADETWWRLMGGPQDKKHWAWYCATKNAVWCKILPSRSVRAAGEILEGFEEGVLLVDDYAGYKAWAREHPGVVIANCWAHARRRLVKIEKEYPDECGTVLDLMGKLFEVERELAEREAGPNEILDERRRRSKPVLRQIHRWCATVREPRESDLRKAIEHMVGIWPGLTRFLDDPRIPLTNNLIEGQIRAPAMGRRNHLGSRSERGIEVAGILYSLIHTAKLQGIDPRDYLRRVAVAAIAEPGTVALPTGLAN